MKSPRTLHFDYPRQAIRGAMEALLEEPRQPCGSMGAELLGTTIVIEDNSRSLVTSTVRKFNYRAMISESLWNISPSNDIKYLLPFHKGVRNFVSDQDDDGQMALWGYGPHLNKQVGVAFRELTLDPRSRRARVSIAHPDAKGTPPCLTSAQWLIRDGLLHMIVNMRSNDVWLGLPLDILQFSFWHHLMGAALGVKLGMYVHQTGSLHMYERDEEKVTAYLRGRESDYAFPPVSHKALRSALANLVLKTVVDYPGPDPADVAGWEGFAPGLGEYTAALCGDYRLSQTFLAMQFNGFGIGW